MGPQIAARPPVVLLRGVERGFARGSGRVRVLRGLDLVLPAGRAVALVGPNGAGKSTALRVVAGLLPVDAGSVRVFGRDISSGGRPDMRRIGVSLGSDRSVYWRLSARGNLVFAGRLRGLTGARLRESVARLLAETGLGGRADVPARRLSRGEVARLSLARALLGAPGLLLLDEPLSSVDRSGREKLWTSILCRRQGGAAVLVATHDRAVAEACDDVVGFQEGACLHGRRARRAAE